MSVPPCLRIYFGFCIGCSLMATIMSVISLASNNWEIVYFQKDYIIKNAAIYNSSVTFNDTEGYFTVRETNPSNGSVTVRHIASVRNAGLWESCDTISDSVRTELERTGILGPKCTNYLNFDEDTLTKEPTLDMLMGLNRSANACAIVALITIALGVLLGLFSAFRQQIIFATVTGVCFCAAGIYLAFTVGLMILHKNKVKDDNSQDLPEFIEGLKIVEISWSSFMCWTGFVFSVVAGICWILMSIELKKTRLNFVYSSQYDQICSM